MNRLLILDGNALLHRAYHALPPLNAPDGQQVGAVYGFISMIIRLRQDLKPTHMAVCFDRPVPTFRKKMYKEYQSQRPEMDEILVSQIVLTHDAVKAFSIPIFEQDGYEADDVIGTLAKQLQATMEQIIIVTGDRDILQLVSADNTLVYMPVKGLSESKLYGEKEVVERIGVLPHQIPDWKGLCGDSSDNYPGVPGIGPKTATDLIKKHGTIETLYKGLEEGSILLTERLRSKLIEGKESAFLSKDLATIRTNVELDIDAELLSTQLLNSENVIEILRAFGFPSLIKRLSIQLGRDIAEEKTSKQQVNAKSEQMSLL
jgi:DNA polymerase I